MLAFSDLPVLSCNAIDPTVDVSGGPAMACTSVVADVPTAVDVPFDTGVFQRSIVTHVVVVPAVVGVPAVVVFQLLLVTYCW